MANSRLCSIPGCGKRVFGHGWCNAHYSRWRRKGNPLGVSTSQGEPPSYFSNVVLKFEGDECLPWPYANNGHGYGVLWHGGKMCSVHRLVCEAIHGAPPSATYEAAHECGNGHLGCVNPRHLSWKTISDNQSDRIQHGTHQLGQRNAMAKLTEEDVRTIRALQGVMPTSEIAAKFGIHRMYVNRIQRRERWAWLD